MRFGVDSGAAFTVVRPDTCQDYPRSSPGGTRKLRAANGSLIPDCGNRDIVVAGEDGRHRIVRSCIAPVTKNLLSVGQLVDAEHTVIFSKKGSVIKHDVTGETINMKRNGCVFEVDLDVVPFSEAPLFRGGRAGQASHR